MIGYYESIWNMYGIKFNETKEEKPTAESLRAAAKVLEEKAKELDKPKLTAHQEATIDKAKEYDIDIIKFSQDNTTYSYVNLYDSSWTEEKKGSVQKEEYKHKRLINTFLKTNIISDKFNRFVTMIDEDNKIHTYLEWPNS